jgi:hypothetical protein
MRNPLSQKVAAVLAVALGTMLAVETATAQADVTTRSIKAVAVKSTLEGEVMVVNTDTRLMTIRKADGSFEVLRVPPEVKRLRQVRPHNMVSLTKLTLAVIEHQTGPGAGAVGAAASTTVDRDNRTHRPSGTVADTLRLSGQVTDVNPNAGTVTIRGPRETRTFEIEDKQRIGEVKVGDGVVVTIRNVVSGEVTLR